MSTPRQVGWGLRRTRESEHPVCVGRVVKDNSHQTCDSTRRGLPQIYQRPWSSLPLSPPLYSRPRPNTGSSLPHSVPTPAPPDPTPGPLHSGTSLLGPHSDLGRVLPDTAGSTPTVGRQPQTRHRRCPGPLRRLPLTHLQDPRRCTSSRTSVLGPTPFPSVNNE